MLRKKLLYIFIAILALTTSVYAQDVTVREIPVASQLFGVTLSPDEQTIAVFENTALHMDEVIDQYLPIHLINVADGSEKATFTGATDYASDVAFTPDSTKAASYHSNGYIYLWNISDGSLIKTINALPGYAQIKFLPDGKTLAVLQSGSVGQLLLWDMDTGYIKAVFMQRFDSFKEWKEKQFGGSGGGENYAAFDITPNGNQLAVVTVRGNIWLWDIASGEGSLIHASNEELPLLNIRSLYFTPDGSSLVYLDTEDEMIHSLDVKTGNELTIQAAGGRQFTLSPDGTMVAWITATSVFASQLSQNAEPQEYPLSLPDGIRAVNPQMYLGFTADNSQLITGGFINTSDDDNFIYVITL